MSRITHFSQQPLNIQYWDYYILCHLNIDAAIALQRMEFWDGTKDGGNVHAEAINDANEKAGFTPVQDTSNWIYKSQDELQWELMGVAGERRLTKIINLLVDDLKYMDRRSNPLEGWDRTKQYRFNATLLQEQINYLGYIISFFNLPTRYMRPVFYAIEILTNEKVYIDALNVEKIIEKIESLKNDPKIPHFMKEDLAKFEKVFMKPLVSSFRTFAEWKAHFCGMEPAKMRDGKRKSAECIPQKCGSNTIEDTYGTNNEDPIEDSKEESVTPTDETTPPQDETSVSSPHTLFSDSHNDAVPAEETKPTKPEMPPAEMKWSAEKLVRVTECLRFCDSKQGAYFSTTPTGKKGQSQRDRQLLAAKKIFAEIPDLTEKDYILAYSDRNDDWWNQSQGSLTVEAMAANTKNKRMRTSEVLEKVRSRSEHVKEQKPVLQLVPTQEAPKPSKKVLSPEELKSMSMAGW